MHVKGDVYPLTEAPEDDWTKWCGQQVHDPEEGCGTVQIFRRRNSSESEYRLSLSRINPDGIYRIEYFSGESFEGTGAELKNLTVRLDQPRSFQVIHYRLEK